MNTDELVEVPQDRWAWRELVGGRVRWFTTTRLEREGERATTRFPDSNYACLCCA